jgi:F-type H+-transporting ATPase subunit gamma
MTHAEPDRHPPAHPSVKNTQQITKAMKMVSAAKLRRAQDRVFVARPYARDAARCSTAWLSRRPASRAGAPAARRAPGEPQDPARRDHGRRACAAASTPTSSRRAQFPRRPGDRPRHVELEAGRPQGPRLLPPRGFDVAANWWAVPEGEVVATRRRSPSQADRASSGGEVDAVYLVYNEFKSVMSQRVVVERLLPDRAPTAAGGRPGRLPLRASRRATFWGHVLLPRTSRCRSTRRCSNPAAEHAARMTAMDAATSQRQAR